MNSRADKWYGVEMYASRMGRYTTGVERAFIQEALRRRAGELDILDGGGGAGRHAG